MKLTKKKIKQLIQEAVFDYKTSLDKREDDFKNLDSDMQQGIARFLDSADTDTVAQGHELVDTLTGYKRSGMGDIEALKRFNLGQMYNMIPGLEEMGRSPRHDDVNYHDKLVQLLQNDRVEMYLMQQNQDDEQEARIESTGIVKPEDVSNLYVYALHSTPSVNMTQDILFDGLTMQSGGLSTIPYEQAIIDYVIRYAKSYEVEIM